MRDLRTLVVWLLMLMLTLSGVCSAAERFSSEEHRQAFLRVLARLDAQYDPAQRMLRSEFSSPGYHTTLTGGVVHRTCPSLEYAVALLDTDRPEALERAQDVLTRVIALQDQDPNSPTYGIWPWFLEEPIGRMSPPDWNWADFCGVQLLQVAIDHMDRLPIELQQQVRNSILHAARSIQRRNVGPEYTNGWTPASCSTTAGSVYSDSTTTPAKWARSPSTTARRTRAWPSKRSRGCSSTSGTRTRASC
jgi:hypothetical protein